MLPALDRESSAASPSPEAGSVFTGAGTPLTEGNPDFARSATFRFRYPYDLNGVSADRPRDGDELGHVQAPLAQFEFRDKRLSLPKAPAQLDLGDAGILSHFNKKLDHFAVKIRTE